MLRKFVAVAAIALLLVTAIGATAVASGHVAVQFVSVSGSLEYVPDLPIPHYEVNGYVLLGVSADMTAMVGDDVMVIGTEVTGPSIYMRRTLQVSSLIPSPSVASTPGEADEPIPLPAPTPSEPAGDDTEPNTDPPATADPPSDPSDGRVTTPVLPEPAQGASDTDPTVSVPVVGNPGSEVSESDPEVTIPVITEPIPAATDPGVDLLTPAPLYGVPLSSVLFGRAQTIESEYYLVDPANGHIHYRVRSEVVSLGELVGQLVAAIATPNSTPDGAVWYDVTETVTLSRDLADQVQRGNGLMFQLPAGEIAIRLHGQTVHWTPTPIIGNGRTLVGLRSVSEAFGATVAWDDATKTATVHLGDREVSVSLGSSLVILHRKGQPDRVVQSDTASIIAEGRMMVPLRVISEGLGVSVSWDESTRTVNLD